MKGKVLSALVFLAIYLVVDLLFFQFLSKAYSAAGPASGLIKASEILYFIIVLLLLFIFVQNLLYNSFYNFKSSKPKVLLGLVVPLLLSIHIADRVTSLNYFYFFKKQMNKDVSAGLWTHDDKLGHKPVANASGTYDYIYSDSVQGSVPVIFSDQGFRTVPENQRIIADTTNLFLGCSFTFGGWIPAEQSYSYLVSKELGNAYVNAGGSAYGMGQMQILGDRLIPNNTYKYVFLQMSPWLADRAMSLTGPTYSGYRPFPYFTDSNERFELHYPAFSNHKFNKIKSLRTTDHSYIQKWRFTFGEGIAVKLFDYYAYTIAKYRVRLGLLAKPTKQKRELEKYFYSNMIATVRASGATPIVLKLKYDMADCKDLVDFIEAQDVMVVDLDVSLDSLSGNDAKKYDQLFSIYHYTATDSFIIDRHPNALANKLFTQTILKHIR